MHERFTSVYPEAYSLAREIMIQLKAIQILLPFIRIPLNLRYMHFPLGYHFKMPVSAPLDLSGVSEKSRLHY